MNLSRDQYKKIFKDYKFQKYQKDNEKLYVCDEKIEKLNING